ncbi:hypothetical protein L9F63_020598, partial [Diploptera punctata]
CIHAATDAIDVSEILEGLTDDLMKDLNYLGQVSVGSSTACIGVVIHKQHVLVPAHCVRSSEENTTTVTFMTSIPQKVIAIYQHNNYNEETQENNIAVIRLDEELTFNDTINKIELSHENTPAENTSCTFTGREGTKEVIIKNNKICSAGEGLICASIKDSQGSTSCQLTEGAPLIFDGKLIGVASTTSNTDCSELTFLGVKKYEDWIYPFTDSAVTIHVSPLVLLCSLAAIIKMRS